MYLVYVMWWLYVEVATITNMFGLSNFVICNGSTVCRLPCIYIYDVFVLCDVAAVSYLSM